MATPSPEDLKAFLLMTDASRDSRVGLILAVEIPLVVIMVGIVCARFYARTVIKKILGKDDWVMALSAIFASVITGINCISTAFGSGLHAWNANQRLGLIDAKLGWIYAVLFTPAVTFCKISIVMTYLRIFPAQRDRVFCFAALGYLTLSGLVVTLVVALQCIPVNSYWDLSVKNKKCYNQKIAMMLVSSLNSLSDLAVFLWPAPKLWDVQLPVRRRIGLILLFSMGITVCIAGIVRIVYYPIFFGSKDVFWEGAVVCVVADIECNLGIICGSLPEVRPLFARVIHPQASQRALNVHSTPKRPTQATNSAQPGHDRMNRNQRDEKAVSADSFNKIYKWIGGRDSVAGMNEPLTIEQLSPTQHQMLPYTQEQDVISNEGIGKRGELDEVHKNVTWDHVL